jgi:hypothetical protein
LAASIRIQVDTTKPSCVYGCHNFETSANWDVELFQQVVDFANNPTNDILFVRVRFLHYVASKWLITQDNNAGDEPNAVGWLDVHTQRPSEIHLPPSFFTAQPTLFADRVPIAEERHRQVGRSAGSRAAIMLHEVPEVEINKRPLTAIAHSLPILAIHDS